MKKTETIISRISPELKAKSKELAEKDGRSLSSYVLQLVRKDLRKG